jgi:hypothetical protein
MRQAFHQLMHEFHGTRNVNIGGLTAVSAKPVEQHRAAVFTVHWRRNYLFWPWDRRQRIHEMASGPIYFRFSRQSITAIAAPTPHAMTLAQSGMRTPFTATSHPKITRNS